MGCSDITAAPCDPARLHCAAVIGVPCAETSRHRPCSGKTRSTLFFEMQTDLERPFFGRHGMGAFCLAWWRSGGFDVPAKASDRSLLLIESWRGAFHWAFSSLMVLSLITNVGPITFEPCSIRALEGNCGRELCRCLHLARPV